MSDEEQPRRRGGSKKGRTFQKVKREPGDELRRRFFRLLDSEFSELRRIGRGNATRGIRELLRVARQLRST